VSAPPERFGLGLGGLDHGALKVSRTPPAEAALVGALTLAGTVLMILLLKRFTPSTVPILDATVTGLSIAAQALMARKRLENWWIWIGANLWANRERIGDDFLQQTAAEYGFTAETGIDLAGEREGFAFTPAQVAQLHEDYPEDFPYGDWTTGNTINMSIGGQPVSDNGTYTVSGNQITQNSDVQPIQTVGTWTQSGNQFTIDVTVPVQGRVISVWQKQ